MSLSSSSGDPIRGLVSELVVRNLGEYLIVSFGCDFATTSTTSGSGGLREKGFEAAAVRFELVDVRIISVDSTALFLWFVEK